MKKSINRNGCSFCKAGNENYTTFINNGKTFYQYDFRNIDGVLFSCVSQTLEECRRKKDDYFKEYSINLHK